jgi:ubiquinone/menaquinone biosynthesis C-methylase UbiE
MKTHGAYSEAEAESYDQDRAGELLWTLENQYVEALLQRNPTANVLDAPVGTGRFLANYAGRSVLGVDLSEAMLAVAKERGQQIAGMDLTLAKAGIHQLPSADRAWDLVICWRLLHLLSPDQLGMTFKELARVCRGQVCVQCYVPDSLQRRTAARFWRWVQRFGLIFRRRRSLTPWSHIRSFNHTADNVKAAAAAAGLILVREDLLGEYEGTQVLALLWNTNA